MKRKAAARTIVFEGFGDTEPGWDFDMPVYMIRPVKREGIGGSVHYAENMVEDYLIDLSLGDEIADDPGVNWKYVMRLWRRAKRGERPQRLIYWRCEAVLPEGLDPEDDEWIERVEVSPIEYGAPNAEA